MARRPILQTVLALALCVAAASVGYAAVQTATLAAGDTLNVTCPTQLSGTIGTTGAQMVCATATALATGTTTSTHTPTHTMTPPPTSTQAPTNTPGATSPDHPCAGGNLDAWHGTLEGTTRCGHEHGDAPPSWLTLHFVGAFNTSPHEHALSPNAANPTRLGKHNAMKGLAWTSPQGVDYYIRYHAATNVLDRMARFHSAEVWAREANGKISHVAGWWDSGDPNRFGSGGPAPNGGPGDGGRRDKLSFDGDFRPEVDVVISQGDFDLRNKDELWYFYPVNPGIWLPTFSILINATTLAFPGEASNPSMTTWQPTGGDGSVRGGGITWNAGSAPVKDAPFWSTQFGEAVTGPSDPRCSGTTSFAVNLPPNRFHLFSQPETHPNVCLQQIVSSTLPAVNAGIPQRAYTRTGLVLPN
jgi:hypothetical protein